MKDLRIKLVGFSLLLCFFLLSPASANETDEIVVDVFPESNLDKDFNADLYFEIVEVEDVEELSNKSEEVAEHIVDIEKKINHEISAIHNIENELKTLKMSQHDLNKYLPTQDIDIAEKEVANGISYDKDIYDHGKELADSDTQLLLEYTKL